MKERRKEIDKKVGDLIEGFQESATTTGDYGAFYLSGDMLECALKMEVACTSELLVNMLIGVMEQDDAIAADILRASNEYMSREIDGHEHN